MREQSEVDMLLSIAGMICVLDTCCTSVQGHAIWVHSWCILLKSIYNASDIALFLYATISKTCEYGQIEQGDLLLLNCKCFWYSELYF